MYILKDLINQAFEELLNAGYSYKTVYGANWYIWNRLNKTYGEDEGIKKWNNFNNARIINRSYSMISQDLFRTIIQNDIFKDHEIYFAEYNYEYEVYTDTGHLYYLDFYD